MQSLLNHRNLKRVSFLHRLIPTCISFAAMNGYYLYMEATNQRPGDKADLVSKLLPAGHQYCLQFALNMHGSTMGSLDIMIKVGVK